MYIPIKSLSNHPLPTYATQGASGLDLRAYIPAPITLQPQGGRALIPTGLHIALPIGFEAQVRPRSGLALQKGITILNSPGTVDSDYRGEIKVLLTNLGDQPVTIEDGDRIAQLVIAAYQSVTWQPVETLPATPRGDQGYGSTGSR
jgi:dUTP pyrophosphatase